MFFGTIRRSGAKSDTCHLALISGNQNAAGGCIPFSLRTIRPILSQELAGQSKEPPGVCVSVNNNTRPGVVRSQGKALVASQEEHERLWLAGAAQWLLCCPYHKDHPACQQGHSTSTMSAPKKSYNVSAKVDRTSRPIVFIG